MHPSYEFFTCSNSVSVLQPIPNLVRVQDALTTNRNFLSNVKVHTKASHAKVQRRWAKNSLTCPNSVHVLEPAHDFVRDQVAVVPDRKILLPYKRRKRLPPLVGPAQPRVGVLPVVDFGGDVRAPQVETVFQGDASCGKQGKEESRAND
jgi:hypothetical protein